MFVKFVLEKEGPVVSDRQGNEERMLAPVQEYIIEAPFIEYSKQVRETAPWWTGPVTVLGEGPNVGDEMIVLRLPATGDRIVATHCSMFVMNDGGQTIDSLGCP